MPRMLFFYTMKIVLKSIINVRFTCEMYVYMVKIFHRNTKINYVFADPTSCHARWDANNTKHSYKVCHTFNFVTSMNFPLVSNTGQGFLKINLCFWFFSSIF